jgi:SH3 domain protein
MKQMAFILISALIVLICFASAGRADEMYVGDVKTLNVRTGGSTRHKVIASLLPGDKVEMISSSNGWSKIRTSDGKEGWVTSRFLTRPKPASDDLENPPIQMETQPAQAEMTALENNQLKEENISLTTQLNETAIRLQNTEAALETLKTDYETLKTEAADYLSNKENYDQIAAQLEKKDSEIRSLKEKLDDPYVSKAIKWALTGAGILLAGFFLGARTHRKRSSLF